jgi:hypothetical protein
VALAGLAVALLGQTSVADAATLSGDMHEFTGTDLIGRAVFEQVGNDVQVTLSTVQEAGHTNTGDWGGFWFNISDDALLAGMTVTGTYVTAYDFSGSVGSVGGANNNLNGGGSPAPMEAGIAFGSPGASGGLLATVTFTLSHPDGLTLSLFESQTIAGRLQTVGPAPGGGGGSSKITGIANVPEPASLVLMSFGGLMIARRKA